jgi:hypothetical protein
MPIPMQHEKDLEKAGQSVEEAARLLRHPKFRAVLAELHDSSDSRKAAEKDPMGFLAKRGIALSRVSSVKFQDNNWSFGFSWGGFFIGYDSTKGFWAGFSSTW